MRYWKSEALHRPAAMIGALASIVFAAGTHAADPLSPIDLRQIKVGGRIGRRIDVTTQNNLLVIDVETQCLQPFRDRNRRDGYIGLGKLIDSAVRLAAYTGDERVVARKKYLVDEILKTQQPDGYIGIMRPDARVWAMWDVHEIGYLVYGLVSDYRFFGEKSSLDAAKRLADYVVSRWTPQSHKKPTDGTIAVQLAVTGIEPAMLALYEQTGDQRYLDFCLKVRNLHQWDGHIVRGRWGLVEGHAYAHLCRCVGQLRLRHLLHDPPPQRSSRRVIDFLTRDDGMMITGGCGYRECWHDTQDDTSHLAETCATAYLIRFLDELLRMEGESLYGDIMERAIYNSLFAAQSPDGRRIRYYTPLEGPRAYHDSDFYCCPCNYRRIIADLPTMVYYRAGDGLAINLHTPSSAKLELGDGLSLRVRQETDYPNSGRVLIRLDPSQPAEFPLHVRIPRWCAKATIAVNDQTIEEEISGGAFFSIQRQWKPGDRVELRMPMKWRLVKGRKAQAGRVAVMRGPVVFCLNRARHEKLAKIDLREITIIPSSLEGPIRDDTVRRDGLACRVQAWSPRAWHPHVKPDLNLVLTEFTDPGGEATYFKVANPKDDTLVDDELLRNPDVKN